MENETKKIFTDGMIAKEPNEKVKHFVVTNLSFKVEDFSKFLREHAKNGWVNVNVKIGQSGKYYGELDTYEPNASKTVSEIKEEIKDILKPDEVTETSLSREEIEILNAHRNAHNDRLKSNTPSESEILASEIPF